MIVTIPEQRFQVLLMLMWVKYLFG